jgi:ABC-2 type transport system permease protein
MLGTVFRQSLRENLRLNRLLPWILLSVLAWCLGLVYSHFGAHESLVDRYGNLSYLVVFRILALASAIMTSTIVSAEVEQKTIVYLLTRPVPRWVLLLGRYLACSLVVALATGCAALSASIGIFGFDFSQNPLLLRDLAAISLGALSYCGLFLLISLLFNRAMLICILFGFGWESSVPNMPGSVYYISIYSHLQAIAHHQIDDSNRRIALVSGSLNGNNLTPIISVPVLLGVIAVTVGLGLWIFSSFEFVPREDVE